MVKGTVRRIGNGDRKGRGRLVEGGRAKANKEMKRLIN